jgi:hypothetical protein
MKLISVILIIAVMAIYGCKDKKETLTVTINISNTDTCIQLSASDSVLFQRDFEILENNLSDTIGLGYEVVYPGQTGRRVYLREGKSLEMLYIVTPEDAEDLPPIRTIYFDTYEHRPVHGTIILRFKRHY